MRQITLDLSPEEYHQPALMRQAVQRRGGVAVGEEENIYVVRRTLDCRRTPVYHTIISIGEAPNVAEPELPDCSHGMPIVVVGAGPAGLFASMQCMKHGLRPIIVERGKAVEDRKHDIARLTREKIVDANSNWCFGEGGAGTYSDGKLYTRSTKRGDVGAVLRQLVAHGANPDIMLDAHAHIGTDRLGAIIAAIRHDLVAHGATYRFGTRVADLLIREGNVRGVITTEGEAIEGEAVVLATGHSARDIYQLFHRHGWLLQAKPFALGVRVVHPQALINEMQYHGKGYSPFLPPAAYSLTSQVNGRGVFSFCMCPGGVIVPAATDTEQQVVNGMSNSRRNSPWGNSGIAVAVSEKDVAEEGALALLHFQQEVEHRMFEAGGKSIVAPSQRLTDFLHQRPSNSIGQTGYMGETISAPLHELLPPFIATALTDGFRAFNHKMRGFITNEATLLAVESRTSSPVRIPRDPQSLQHPQLSGLYPCGEGAGYAGGIVSSALDGIRCADSIALHLGKATTQLSIPTQ